MWKSLGAAGVIAASICLALVIGPWSGNSVLAQVQNAIKSVKTATYTVTQSVGDGSATTYKVQLFGDNLCRCDLPNGTYIVLDIKAKKIMQVFPSESRAQITEDMPVPEGFNILAKLANPNSIAVKEQPVVPDREINGIKATGFAISENGVRYNVWIDPMTKLPLEMERVRTEAEANQPDVKEKWTDFQFGVVLDKALFVLEVPKGFSVETRKAPADGEKAAEEDRKRAEKAREMDSGSKGFTIAPPHSVGPVRLGMKPEAVKQILGEPDEQRELARHHQLTMDYRKLGLHLTFDTKELGLRAVICLSGKHESAFSRESKPTHAFEGKTESGIGIGSPFSDVRRTFGQPNATDDYFLVPGVVEHTYFNQQLSFLVEGGKVIEIHLVRQRSARDFESERAVTEGNKQDSEVPKGFTVETRQAPAGGAKAVEEVRSRAEMAREEAAARVKGN